VNLELGVTVAPMTQQHSTQVLAVYQAGLDSGNASFETTAPDWSSFDRVHLPQHRFVAVDPAGDVLGWVAASAVSARQVYAGVVEHSVYVAASAQRRGLGRMLVRALIASTEIHGVWTVQTAIFPENRASVGLHLAEGFRLVGTREQIAVRDGRWRDVLLLERRSRTVRSSAVTPAGVGPDAERGDGSSASSGPGRP